jgi:hypothetical protein
LGVGWGTYHLPPNTFELYPMTLKQIRGAKMKPKELLRVLVTPSLVLAIVLFAFDVGVLHAYDLGFPRIIYSCPFDTSWHNPWHIDTTSFWHYFYQIKSEAFNCVIEGNLAINNFQEATVDSQRLNLTKLLEPMYCAFNGQWARYDAGNYVSSGNYGEYYVGFRFKDQHDGENKGKDTLDSSINHWVWYASASDTSYAHLRGYVQSGLYHYIWQPPNDFYEYDFSREQEYPDLEAIGIDVNYHVFFRMKVPDDTLYSAQDTVARIEVWILGVPSDSVKDSVLFYDDFIPGQYTNFRIDFTRHNTQAGDSIDYRVYWYKKTDLFIDYVEVYDAFYDTLINDAGGSQVYQERSKEYVEPYESGFHNTSMFRWYLRDEPKYDQYRSNYHVNRLLDSLNYAHGIQATGCCKPIEKFAAEVQPHEIFYDEYPIIGIDNYPFGYQARLSLFSGRCESMEDLSSQVESGEWWYIAQTYSGTDADRYPHNSELKCTVYLALAYGAKGIGYYRYASSLYWPDDTASNPYSQGGLVRCIGSTTWVPVETFSDPPETLLNAAKETNFWLDSVGQILRAIEWQGACLDDEVGGFLLRNGQPSYIDSIRSHNPADEPHWVQVGFFENQTGDTSYFMLVNRECLETEGADYDVFVNKAGGHYKIRDMYTNTIVGEVNGIGGHFTVYLGPGEGKLLRLEEVPRIKHVPADYPAIQSAINSAWDGDTVSVAPGTYLENINFRGKAITVASQFIFDHNPTTIQATIIDGRLHSPSSVVWFDSGEVSTSVLKGFTITGGTGTYWYGMGHWVWLGGGICCKNSSSPTISNNLIIDNHIPYHPGPQYLAWGGGIGCMGSNPTISNNLILNNSCRDSLGGGIYFTGRPIIVNNTLSGNSGGGITAWTLPTDSFVVSNNIIANNSNGWGIGFESPGSYFPGISYNDVWNNAFGNFRYCPSGVGDTLWGHNVNGTPCDRFYNIIRNPMFVNPGTDYHLQEGSPCINAGDNNAPGLPQFDFDRRPRIIDGYVDMGAYEYITLIRGDANGDGTINSADIAYLINYLFVGGPAPNPLWTGDANCDGLVNSADVAYLINYLFVGGPHPC